jgi:galactoside O-acetyltransferase
VRVVVRELIEWGDALLAAIPGGTGRIVRGFFFKVRMRSAGPGLRIGLGSTVQGERAISIGANCHFGRSNMLFAEGGALKIGDCLNTNSRVVLNASVSGSITIGDNVLIGPNVIIRSASHRFDDPDELIRNQGHISGPITIGSDVWLAANVVVLPNVTIGDGAVVAAGAVVTRDVVPRAIVAGVPARQIGTRGQKGGI